MLTQDYPNIEYILVSLVYRDAHLIDDTGKVVGQFASRQTNYRSMLRGSVHIPQATTFFRADLWMRIAKVSEIRYVPRLWADFRLHKRGKSIVNDDPLRSSLGTGVVAGVGCWATYPCYHAQTQRAH